MSHCHCGEFDRPTIAPDEFGETCFHERDKCEVPPVPVPIETVLRLTRARAEKAEATIQRVRQVAERFASGSGPDPYGFGVARAVAADAVLDALDGDG